MYTTSLANRFSARTIWLIAVVPSVVVLEGIAIPISLFYEDAIDADVLFLSVVASLVVASIIAVLLRGMLKTRRENEACIHNLQRENLAEQELLREDLWWQANYNPLTELPNRALFRDMLKLKTRKSDESSREFAVLYIDVGHLNEVNNVLGYHIGDRLIVDAAKRITSHVQGTDTVAHLTGDEFAMILPGIASTRHVERIAQDLLESLRRPYHLGDEIAYLSASIGIAIYPTDARDVDGLLANAGQGMNLSKAEGGNTFSFYSKSNQEASRNRMRMIGELHGALSKRQLHLYFQPVVDLTTGAIVKAEALIRWLHPERGVIYPTEFIPLAEETGLIHDIGDWVFEESVKFGKHWSSLTGHIFKVSINVSPVQFRMPDRIDSWTRDLIKAGMSGEDFIVEITEGVLLRDATDIENALISLRDAGVEVAIDDFGTGYSSLAYLKKFHIDYLKIDQSFTKGIAHNSSDMALAETIIVMAHKLDMKVIAEGIETNVQRDLLRDAGCDFGQGYLFARPIPSGEFESLLRSNMYSNGASNDQNKRLQNHLSPL